MGDLQIREALGSGREEKEGRREAGRERRREGGSEGEREGVEERVGEGGEDGWLEEEKEEGRREVREGSNTPLKCSQDECLGFTSITASAVQEGHGVQLLQLKGCF